ncbi:alpha/beta hydrolase [Marinobacter bryozoorum]|uniref:alpha/beta fold hydrolase n=1 Tax=Marinobacter bryozoorum TaxID=256324 RepID=UPI002006120D|nr:alpha/beta hydrolase [Marinobacter bryozoorum]MCK7542724.1 alpha/beta hydrolase [Marinobacter bryozoorum]
MQDVIRRNHVQTLGEGDHTLVLAHGFGCDHQIWQPVAEALAPDFRLVLFDITGCGQSDLGAWDRSRHSSLHGYAEDLVEVLAASSSDPVTLVGHSVSGTIAMLASRKAPHHFRQIIAIGPSPRYINDPPDYHGGFEERDILDLLDMMEHNYFEWAGYLSPLAMANSHRPELADKLRQSFAAADPVISRKFAEATFLSDVRHLLPSVPVPVDILYTEQDVIVPPEVVAYLGDHLPACRTTRLGATGHYPHMSNPGAVVTGIRAALRTDHASEAAKD